MARGRRPLRSSARRNFRQMTADLHHHGGVGVGEPARQLALRQRRRQHGENIVALRDRHSRRRPAARHAGDAGDDLGGEPRRQPRVQMHVGAVEQRIALADHRDDAAGIEMRGDCSRGAVVEIADGIAVAVAVLRQFGGDGIEQRQFDDFGAQVLRGDGARMTFISRFGEMRDHVGLAERAHRLERHQFRIARADADADQLCRRS